MGILVVGSSFCRVGIGDKLGFLSMRSCNDFLLYDIPKYIFSFGLWTAFPLTYGH